MRRIVPIIFSCVLLVACKTEFEAEIYASDILAVADGTQERIDISAGITIQILSDALCVQQAPKVAEILHTYFPTDGQPMCEPGEVLTAMRIPVKIPLIPASSRGTVVIPAESSVTFTAAKHVAGRVTLSAGARTGGFQKIQRNLLTDMMVQIDPRNISIHLILNNDLRETLTFETAGVFVDNRAAARLAPFDLDRRRRAKIVLSDVRTLFLLDGGGFPILDLMIPN